MKRNIKRMPALLLAIVLCLSLLPATAWAANIPNRFYAALMNKSGMGTVSSYLTYTSRNTEAQQVYGMEYAGGVFFTVVGKKEDDGWRELRMYNSNLTNSRTIGTVNEEGGGYWIIDTAMDISGAEPVLYGTYNGYALIGGDVAYCSSICQISLTDGKTSNWQTVTGIPETDIIYAIAFDKEGTLYGIGADMGDDGGTNLSLDDTALLERFTSDYDRNFINYSNAEYDALFQQAITCYDDAEQTALYKQMQRNLTEHAANVYIQDLADLVALRTGLEGVQFYPIYVLDLSTVRYAQ